MSCTTRWSACSRRSAPESWPQQPRTRRSLKTGSPRSTMQQHRRRSPTSSLRTLQSDPSRWASRPKLDVRGPVSIADVRRLVAQNRRDDRSQAAPAARSISLTPAHEDVPIAAGCWSLERCCSDRSLGGRRSHPAGFASATEVALGPRRESCARRRTRRSPSTTLRVPSRHHGPSQSRRGQPRRVPRLAPVRGRDATMSERAFWSTRTLAVVPISRSLRCGANGGDLSGYSALTAWP